MRGDEQETGTGLQERFNFREVGPDHRMVFMPSGATAGPSHDSFEWIVRSEQHQGICIVDGPGSWRHQKCKIHCPFDANAIIKDCSFPKVEYEWDSEAFDGEGGWRVTKHGLIDVIERLHEAGFCVIISGTAMLHCGFLAPDVEEAIMTDEPIPA